jgi:hypothetical protein
MIPPMRMIPLIAFDPDMSGVCSTAGMFLITSKPKRRLKCEYEHAVDGGNGVAKVPSDSIVCGLSGP